MKIIEVKSLAIPEIKVIRFARFLDNRGYFAEHFRNSDFKNEEALSFLKNVNFLQANESYSKPNIIRGMHFQWNPCMGKLVRPLNGHLIDFALDIRKGSPTFGKIVAYDMPTSREHDYDEWIWVPPGFAHGVVLPEESLIEYMCSGEYSPGCEASISPLAPDIDWSMCDPGLKEIFRNIATTTQLMTDKDRNGHTLDSWQKDENSNNFIF